MEIRPSIKGRDPYSPPSHRFPGWYPARCARLLPRHPHFAGVIHLDFSPDWPESFQPKSPKPLSPILRVFLGTWERRW